jgi:hypothetical protein
MSRKRTSTACGPTPAGFRRPRCGGRRQLSVLLAVSVASVLALATPALAAPAPAANAAQANVCGDAAPAISLLASGSTQSSLSISEIQRVAGYKAGHDTEGVALRRLGAAAQTHEAQKFMMPAVPAPSVTMLDSDAALQACAQGRTSAVSPQYTSGPGYGWVDNLNQQGQVTNYYCGPATVSEMAWSVPGPSNVNQWTAGSWMGVTTAGTSVDQMVNGLNHFVGVPDYGWNFYAFVWMDYNPTSQQRSDFLSRLQTDVTYNSPVAGDAWEASGGPHLLGHPVSQTIFHWFEIGGWSTNTSQVYYADSATSVWSSVHPYNWQDTYTVETILGGRGYVW